MFFVLQKLKDVVNRFSKLSFKISQLSKSKQSGKANSSTLHFDNLRSLACNLFCFRRAFKTHVKSSSLMAPFRANIVRFKLNRFLLRIVLIKLLEIVFGFEIILSGQAVLKIISFLHLLCSTATTLKKGGVQRTSIADGGVFEKRAPGNRSSLFIQRLKIYSAVQQSSVRPSKS